MSRWRPPLTPPRHLKVPHFEPVSITWLFEDPVVFFLWRKKMPGTRKSGGDVVFSGFCFFLSMYALYILQKQKCTCRCKLHVFCFTMKTKTDLRIFRVIDGSHFTGRISYDSWSRSWQNVTETNRTLYYLVCVCVCVSSILTWRYDI